MTTKGELANHGQFLMLPECFQKSSAAEVLESVYMWERINEITHGCLFSKCICTAGG